MPLRTFLALDLDVPIVAGLVKAQQQLANPADKVKWVERENLHVTLKFLGDVPDDLLTDVCRQVAAAAARVQPFSFDVRGLTVSPTHGPIRMIWAGVRDNSGMIGVLHDELDKMLPGLGPQEHRLYRPHITLARVKHVKIAALFRGAVATWADREFGFQHCDEVVAYTSSLGDEGPTYTPLYAAPIGSLAS